MIAINPAHWGAWLRGPFEGATALIRLTAIDESGAGADDSL